LIKGGCKLSEANTTNTQKAKTPSTKSALTQTNKFADAPNIKITNRFCAEDVVENLDGHKIYSNGDAEQSTYEVLIEHTLDVYLNSVLTMRIICTPDNLVELVVGRLFTEGYISIAEEINDIYICEFGTRAQVTLAKAVPDFSKKSVETVPSCCTGNKTYNEYFLNDIEPDQVKPIKWQTSWIFDAANKFANDSPIHKSTGGTHSCYLMLHGKVEICCEDIGRHNAFDKVLGAALLLGLDLSQSLIFSSGRLPADMVMKAIRAGVPILASKAVPTTDTVNLAKKYKLTLICSAHRDSAIIYNDPINEPTNKAAI
jgi:FdhD protein